MRIHVAICMLAVLAGMPPAMAQDDTLSALFIGNSHTYYNDMPQLFADLAESGGKVVLKDQSAPGGYTLMQHTTNQTTLDKIAQGGWDYVVLQENSQYPVVEYLRYNSMYPASHYLDSLIHQVGGQTAFFLSWGWRFGGHIEIDGHESPVFEDYFEMQDSMNSAYMEIASELNATLVPAGIGWSTAVIWNPELVIWAPDNYHPAPNGSYLTACVFYATLFEESPIGLGYIADLDSAEALFLQQAAWETLTGVDDVLPELPVSFELMQNYPNPFNASTTIEYYLPRDSQVKLTIYDMLGRKVKTLVDCYQQAGLNNETWQANELISSGIYFYRLQADSFISVRRLIYLK